MAWRGADDRHEGYVEYVFADGSRGSVPGREVDPVRRQTGRAAAVGGRRVAGGL
jgi:hypothetical protein